MKNKNNFFFIIGGHDLEMIEIRNILLAQEIDFLDANLKWGASWNDYQKKYKHINQIKTAVNSGKTIIGIELSDFPKDNEQFLLIDHHNERQDEPASIEQVAKLFDIELDRWQLLVAANDKGFIPAMEAMKYNTFLNMTINLL